MPSPSRSEAFRARVRDAYEDLSPADLEAVEEVCGTLDLIERLRAAVADGDLAETRQGGRRIRPEIVELRLQTTTLDKLLRRFPALAEDDE
jgi:hypothetical protein